MVMVMIYDYVLRMLCLSCSVLHFGKVKQTACYSKLVSGFFLFLFMGVRYYFVDRSCRSLCRSFSISIYPATVSRLYDYDYQLYREIMT